jgi:glutathione S-transferase
MILPSVLYAGGFQGRTTFVKAFLSDNVKEDYPKYQQGERLRSLRAVDEHLNAHSAAQSGPFIVGNTFSYGDIVLYQILHDDGLSKEGRQGLKDYPRLKKLADATEYRPNIKAFLQSERYKG